MPTWGNTDNHNQKPKFDVERETREVVQLTLASSNVAGNTIIVLSYNDGAQNNVANVGVATGQYVYFIANYPASGGTSGNGYPGIFASNTTVSAISGNTVTITPALFEPVTSGWTVEFDKAIAYPSTKGVEKTYNADTILVTPTRMSAQNAEISNHVHQGWVHVQKKTNNDGTVRYITETLVALANATASNTASGNTSWGQAFANT